MPEVVEYEARVTDSRQYIQWLLASRARQDRTRTKAPGLDTTSPLARWRWPSTQNKKRRNPSAGPLIRSGQSRKHLDKSEYSIHGECTCRALCGLRRPFPCRHSTRSRMKTAHGGGVSWRAVCRAMRVHFRAVHVQWRSLVARADSGGKLNAATSARISSRLRAARSEASNIAR
jgi:hypothetical protein